MSRHPIATPPLVAIVVIAAAGAACHGSTSPVAPGNTPPPGATQQCRTFATAWTSTYTFAQPTSSSATFSESDRLYREYSPAGSSQLVRRVTYATVADFIDEAATFGRFLSRQTEMCAERNHCIGGLVVVETPTYDSRRRRSGLTLRLNGLPLFTDAYDQWDEHGRPLAGTRSEVQCATPVSLTYDDAARTLAIAPVAPGGGLLCIGLGFASRQTFDADGNVISETSVAGGTSTSVNHTITSTSQICK
jgi:hypothetical protein